MNISKFEERFLDYLENTLAPESKLELETALSQSDELRASFHAYKEILELEAEVANEQHAELDTLVKATIVGKVLKSKPLKAQGPLAMFWNLGRTQRYAIGGFAMLALLVTFSLHNDPVLRSRREIYSEYASGRTQTQEAKSNSESGKAPIIPDPILVSNKLATEPRQDSMPDLNGEDKNATITAPVGATAKNKVQLEEINKADVQHQAIVSGWLGAVNKNLERGQIQESDSFHYKSSKYITSTYNHYDENPRIRTTSEGLSTFSIDVDTGSYTNSRRYLAKGDLPPPDAVRIEEFLNYFDYSYPVQTERPFTLSYEIAPSPLEPGKHLLKLGIRARDLPFANVGWNLVFLVDVSGSMDEENKLPLVKKALKILAQNMRPEDSIALVTYAGNAGLALPPTTGQNRSTILAAIDELGAGGSTHGSAGIKLAYEVAERAMRPNGVNRVILATDGDFNVGVTSQKELIELIEQKRSSGVTLTTIGVGTDNLMDGTIEQLANKGNGNYFYLDSLNEARKVMETDIAGNMAIVAKDVKLQIEFNPENVVEYRLIGYDNRKLNKEDFNNDRVDAGEIGSGHTVTALYELTLKGSANDPALEPPNYRYLKNSESTQPSTFPSRSFSKELAYLKIRYKAPNSDISELVEYPINAADILQSATAASADFRFASAVSYFGHLLRESKYSGNYTYSDVVKLAESGRGSDKYGYRQEFINLVKNAGTVAKK